MTEKLNKEESIARVYQFLSVNEDWKEKADRNKDDVIIQSEFKSYMLQFEREWNGEQKYDSNDIINKFWNSVDVNRSGKSTSVKGNNKNALDNNEMANIEKNIAITNAIKALFNVDGFKCPDAIKDKERWRTSMTASLLNKAQGYSGSLENQPEIVAYLKPLFSQSVAKTNADCIKDQIMQDEIAKLKSQPEYANLDYPFMDDSQLNKIINTYIKSLKGSESFEDICDSIECLIKDYLATAGIGQGGSVTSNSTAFDVPVYDENGQVKTDASGARQVSKRGSQTTSTERLTQYGYDGYRLNDLQKSVFSAKLTKAINDELAKEQNSATYKQYKAAVDARVLEYVNEKASTSGKTFDELIASVSQFASDFITNELSAIKTNAEAQVLEDAKTNAKTTVAGYAAKEEYKEAVKEIFGDDYKATIDACTDTKVIEDLIQKLETKIAEIDKAIADKAKYEGSFTTLSSVASSISSDSSAISSIASGHSEIHTEFGLDANGNIVFEQRDTTGVYGSLAYKVKTEFKLKNPEQYELLKDKLDRLIQASWIMTYSKDYGSSTSHNTEEFIKKVLTNMQLMLQTIQKDPKYLDIYTQNMSYADSSVTSGVRHYAKNDTVGNDQTINYGDGAPYTKPDGTVHLANSTDDPDYQATMSDLLANLKKKYASIGNDDLIEAVFRQAQIEAIQIFQGNIQDCPFGTTAVFDFWEIQYGTNTRPYGYIATEHVDWSGTNRSGDKSVATMQAIVQQTLYCFDRLLYAKLAE